MNITYIGHACFKLESDGFSVVIDPYSDGSVPGLENIRETAGMVLCSHTHHDHNAADLITIEGDNRDNPYMFTAVSSYHDDAGGTKRGGNTIYIIDDGDVKVAHLGDLGCIPEREILDELDDLDALFIPVGGFYTIDGATAAKLVELIQPRVIIPMHYRGEGFGLENIGPVTEFTGRFRGMAYGYPDGTMELDSSTPMHIAVLTPTHLKK